MSFMLPNKMSPKMLLHFLSYMEKQGIPAQQLLERAGITSSREELSEFQMVATTQFCAIYKASVEILEENGKPVAWAGGLGGKTFRLLCHCIESATNLKEVLGRANDLTGLLDDKSPVVSTLHSENYVALSYDLFSSNLHRNMIPSGTVDHDYYMAISIASSLQVWHMYCSWLIGTVIDLKRVDLCCAYVNDDYHEKLLRRFGYSTISYGCKTNKIYFSPKYLDYKIVQSKDSIKAFLKTAPYPLFVMSSGTSSIQAAVKALIGSNFTSGPPTFDEAAEYLNVSPSSLRRKLMKEGTCFQKIKDDCRRDLAADHLQRGNISIKELSALLGFKSAGSFSRSFRQWMGVSPKTFQQSASKSTQPPLKNLQP